MGGTANILGIEILKCPMSVFCVLNCKLIITQKEYFIFKHLPYYCELLGLNNKFCKKDETKLEIKYLNNIQGPVLYRK